MEAKKGMYCSELSSNHACAFCTYHNCHLTARQMKCKGCLNKQCKNLVKNEDHPYWKQREAMKEKRKARKHRFD